MIKYTEKQFYHDVSELSARIAHMTKRRYTTIYAVPKGGFPLACALSTRMLLPMVSVDDITETTLIVDDLVDSGATRSRFSDNDFACIHCKVGAKPLPTFALYYEINDWIVYFWEEDAVKSISDAVTRQLQYIGEDCTRDGLLETPARVVKSWDFLFSGYKQDPADIIKVFDMAGYDEMVLLRDIEVYSMCEHHLLPFFGKAHIAYIPDKKVIGVSKLARLVDMYARRAQIQERICEQVTNALMQYLQPKGAACIIEAQHLCMLMRGVQKQNSVMVTSSLKGVFLDKLGAREELMRLIK